MVSSEAPKTVSVELVTDLESITTEIGLNVHNSCYISEILDSCQDTPILVKAPSNKYYLLAWEIMKGDLSPDGHGFRSINKPNVEIIYYGHYFTWDKSVDTPESIALNHAEALSRTLPVSKVEVSRSMALDKYREFQREFHVELESTAQRDFEIFVYEVDKERATAVYNKGRSDVVSTAVELIDHVSTLKGEDKDLIKEWLSINNTDRFAVLDALMKEKGVSFLLASSKLNIQGLTALPWGVIKESYLALYTGHKVLLLSSEPIEYLGLGKVNDYENLKEAVDDLAGDAAMAVEEKHLGIGRSLDIGLNRIKDAADLFRAWHEQTTWFDLPYYIIAAQATRHAIENTLVFVEKGLKAGKRMTEIDAENKFTELIGEFLAGYTSSLVWEKVASIHSGTRTLYPCQATSYPLSEAMNSLRIDAGIQVFHNGILHGCSDVARTLTLTKGARQLYHLLQRNLIRNVIPAIKPGNTGADVYWTGITPLIKIEERIREWGMLPAGVSLKDDYRRDIGHLLAKQNAVTLRFRKEYTKQALQSGMIGSAEYIWPYKKHALAIEDMYLVTDKKGVCISR